MFFTWNTAWPMPSGPVRKPEIVRPGWNAVVGDRGAVERLQPVAGRIGEADQLAHETLIGQAAGSRRTATPAASSRGAERVERGGVRDLEAEIALAVGQRAVDDQALLAVVHAEGAAGVAALDHLHAEPVGGEIGPVGQVGRADADIAEGADGHCLGPPGGFREG